MFFKTSEKAEIGSKVRGHMTEASVVNSITTIIKKAPIAILIRLQLFNIILDKELQLVSFPRSTNKYQIIMFKHISI